MCVCVCVFEGVDIESVIVCVCLCLRGKFKNERGKKGNEEKKGIAYILYCINKLKVGVGEK